MGCAGDTGRMRDVCVEDCAVRVTQNSLFFCVCVCVHSTRRLVRPLRISAQRVTLILPSCFPAGEVKWRGLIISLITVTVRLPGRQQGESRGRTKGHAGQHFHYRVSLLKHRPSTCGNYLHRVSAALGRREVTLRCPRTDIGGG